MADWGEAIPLFKQRYVSELLPLRDRETALHIQLALSLDMAHGQKGVTKGEKRKLSTMIAELALLVLARKDDDQIKALYNTHSQSDFDVEEAARQNDMKSMLEEMLGMDLGDDIDLNSPDEVMQRLESQFRAQHEAGQGQTAPRKKTAKQLARDAQREAEEKQMSQSIREVYRKLASALHPDREPDPVERQRKTELMQRANEAYEKGNLLQLLELQLQLEHIDQAHLATLGEERLKHYIKILKGQLGELEAEIQHVEYGFAAEFGLSPFERLRPHELMPMLHADLADCEINIRRVQAELDNVGDPKQLKAWLKTITLRRQRTTDLDFPF
ncbi:MAG: J domain-containing protein [Zoogloea sp.]|nr:J domain-containing protein [Zoogloea sp.]